MEERIFNALGGKGDVGMIALGDGRMRGRKGLDEVMRKWSYVR